MKQLFFLLTLVFTMSAFASGFQTSDLEQKEKVELSQAVDFDKVQSIEVLSFDNSEENRFVELFKRAEESFDKQFQERLKELENDLDRLDELLDLYEIKNNLAINQLNDKSYILNGYVPWKLLKS